MPELTQIFLLGMFYGATVCTVTCLPYVGPYILTTGNGFKDGVQSSTYFLFGKLITYTLMGAIAGYIGSAFVVDNGEATKYIVGVLLIAAGVSIPFNSKKKNCGKHKSKEGSLFVLGIASSLIPCPVLSTVILLSAKNGTVVMGASYGMAYGIGILISPLLIVGGGLSVISGGLKEKIGEFIPVLQIVAAISIIGQGIKVMLDG